MDDKQAVAALQALAQDTRLRVFKLLAAAGPEGAPAGEIARALAAPANTMSAHLAVLARAGLLRATRHGRTIRYALAGEDVRALFDFLMADCCGGRPDLCGPRPVQRGGVAV